MKVSVGLGGSIIVDDDVYPLNINTTTEDVSSHEDAFFKSLERGVSADTKRSYQVTSPKMESESRTVPLGQGQSEY